MNAPIATPEIARAVLDPQSYADWTPLLDLFDSLRAESPLMRIESPNGRARSVLAGDRL